MNKIKVGVLGATGAVGQRFVQLLEGHPWFEISALAASGRSAGKPYGEACRWLLSTPMPAAVQNMTVQPCEPELDAGLVFSALPGDQARTVEKSFAQAGYVVSSNTSTHRMEPDVPLLIPEVNPEHLALIELQRRNRGSAGFIVTNPNCSTIALVLALKPLHDAFGLDKVMVTTMQAISGAGYPGVSSLDILDNVIPYIGGEEAKMESEPLKLLGTWTGDGVQNADFAISAQCNRVHVLDGHLEAVSIALREKVTVDDLIAAFEQFRAEPQELGLPSAPAHPVVVHRGVDRPQPRRDRDIEGGMASIVGRIRPCPILDYKFVVLGHNTIRGAAGCAILNAELLKVKGYLN